MSHLFSTVVERASLSLVSYVHVPLHLPHFSRPSTPQNNRRSLTVLRSVTVEASNPFHSPTHASSASSNSLSSAGSGPSPLGGSGFFDGFSAKRSDDTASGGASSTEDLSAVAAAANGGGGGAAAGGEGDHEGKEDGQAPPQ